MNVQKSILSRFVAICCLILAFGNVKAQNFQLQSDLQWVAYPLRAGQIDKPSADWLYKTGENARLSVMLLYHGVPLTDTEISYTIAGDCLPHEGEPRVCLVGADGRALLDVGSRQTPGFLDIRMQCKVEDKTYQNHLKVGFDPGKLTPFTQCPADFDAFWAQELDRQKAIPLKVETEPAPEYSSERVECQKVKIYCYHPGNHYIYGYLSRPKDGKQHPVLVSPPGAGVKHMDPLKTMFYAEQGGFIRLDLEIHGIDPALAPEVYQDITRAFGDHHANGYLANGIASRETYYLRKVYAAMVRAIDYLVSLPDWDGRNIMVQGNSQGAALALVLAGLDPRITAVACAHPALSDMAGYAESNRTGGYPHFGNKYKGVSLTQDVIETLAYYDVTNFAPRIKCPVYMTWGYNDNTCPPTTSWIVWNLLRCPKEKYVTPINEHWISTQTRYRQMEFLQKNLK